VIELVEGFWVIAEDIKAVRHISMNKCTVWVSGIEPIVVNCPAEEVLDALGYFGDESEEETEEEDDDGAR
jgi:hypothetical protein